MPEVEEVTKHTIVKPTRKDVFARKTVARVISKYDDDFTYEQAIRACDNGEPIYLPFEFSSKHRQDLSQVADVTVKDGPIPDKKPSADELEMPDEKETSIREALTKLVETTGISKATLAKLLSEHVTDMNEMADKLEARVNRRIAELKAPNIIRLEDPEGAPTFEGLAHAQFETLLKVANARGPDGCRLNLWITGPAGTGKTTAGKMMASALFKDGLNSKGEQAFMAQGTSDQKYDLTGFINAEGTCVQTEFRRVYRDGGVILIDEVDGWFPNALLAINSATANDFAIFPDGQEKRHPDTIIMCAANTFGHGEVTEYVGRMKQDAAFLDRFVFIDWPVDEELERAVCADQPDWVDYVQAVRERVRKAGYKVLITPRASMYGASLIRAGLDQHTVARMTMKKGMTPDMWDAVK